MLCHVSVYVRTACHGVAPCTLRGPFRNILSRPLPSWLPLALPYVLSAAIVVALLLALLLHHGVLDEHQPGNERRAFLPSSTSSRFGRDDVSSLR